MNGLHIAAHARSCDLTVVTNNIGEFARVPGLLLVALTNRLADVAPIPALQYQTVVCPRLFRSGQLKTR